MTPRLQNLRRVIATTTVCLAACVGGTYGLIKAGDRTAAKVGVGVAVGLLAGDTRAMLAYRKERGGL